MTMPSIEIPDFDPSVLFKPFYVIQVSWDSGHEWHDEEYKSCKSQAESIAREYEFYTRKNNRSATYRVVVRRIIFTEEFL